MARAKKTERAEARRRYREATEGVAEGPDDGLEAPAVSAAALPREYRDRRLPAAAAPLAPTGRPGLVATLRDAAGGVDLRGDLRAFPSLVVRSKAAIIPLIAIVATAAAILIPSVGSNQFVALAGNVLLQPPPMIIAFLAGMLAPRAAWLFGGVTSLLAGLAWIVVIWATTDVQVTPLGFTYVVSAAQKLAYAQNVLITAPVFGVAVGAFAGFYRRFLNLSTPQRQPGGRRR